MKKLFTFLFILISFAGPVFCDQSVDEFFKDQFDKDYMAGVILSHEEISPSLIAPVVVTRLHLRAKPVATKAVPTVLTPEVHKFSKEDSVWASVKVTVTDNHGSYNLNVQSDTPIVGWELNTDDKKLVKQGDANSQQVFGVDINQNFTNNLVLTLFINRDNQTNPIFIALH